MNKPYDFSGWATKNDILCTDGRTIRRDAFADDHGKEVPLVWNHNHDDPSNVLGHAMLENRPEGVYFYGTFNDTPKGQLAKELVQHGDITRVSINANRLKQNGGDVLHGVIREVSLVYAAANSGAVIDSVIRHADGSDEEVIILLNESIELYHADENKQDKKEEKNMAEETNKQETGKTVKDVFDTLTEEQKTVVYAMIGQALEDAGAIDDEEDDDDMEHSDKGGYEMDYNVFEGKERTNSNVLTHADQEEIIKLAKQSGVGDLRTALEIYAQENNTLSHGFESYEALFPEYELTKKGAPETFERDQSWISSFMSRTHKSPISRIRTRYADAKIAEFRALGYQKKGDFKKETAKIKLLGRTTDPQTVYIKDSMHRDDIVDITDFDPVAYQWMLMRHAMDETLALAALIGDGLDDADPDKIHETHIRSIWHDDDLYTIHHDVDLAAARAELQGTNTSANFGENYIFAEAIITAALYSREKYKGSGGLDLYCTPHMLNVMLLARDLNGRRIYDSKTDLAAALNVNAIHTVEQFEGKTRTTSDGKTKKLLGLFVNPNDYQWGATHGGEITKFEDFNMDFNRYQYMLETRLSGTLNKVYCAIALEEPID